MAAVRARKLKQLFESHLPGVLVDDVELLIEVYTEATEEAGAECFEASVLATCLLDLCIDGGPEDPDAAAADLADALNEGFSLAGGAGPARFNVGDTTWAILSEDGEYHEAVVVSVEGGGEDGGEDGGGGAAAAGLVTVRFPDFGVERTLMASQVVPSDTADAVDGDDDGNGGSGACQMCSRDCAELTIHHMIPRSEHTRYMRKGHSMARLKGPENFAMICRPCHNTVHRLASNKVLADTMYTVELINANPQVQRWVAFASTKTMHKLSGKCR